MSMLVYYSQNNNALNEATLSVVLTEPATQDSSLPWPHYCAPSLATADETEEPVIVSCSQLALISVTSNIHVVCAMHLPDYQTEAQITSTVVCQDRS